MKTHRARSRFRRALASFEDAAATQRRHSAAASHAYRAGGAIVGMVAGFGLVAITGWSGGFGLVGAMLLILMDAEGHRRGFIRTGPFASLLLEIALYAFSFGLLGLSGPSLGAPLAYVAVTAVLLLKPLPGLVAVLLGGPGVRLRSRPPGALRPQVGPIRHRLAGPDGQPAVHHLHHCGCVVDAPCPHKRVGP